MLATVPTVGFGPFRATLTGATGLAYVVVVDGPPAHESASRLAWAFSVAANFGVALWEWAFVETGIRFGGETNFNHGAMVLSFPTGVRVLF